MEVNCLRRLAIEVFKTLKSLDLDFMHTYFKKDSHSARRKNDLVINRAKNTAFGEKSIRTLGPEIWDSLPEDVKDLTFLQKFTEFLRNSLKHITDLNANSTSENSWVTHITIVELYTLA